jgi:ADP-heptose:LPS heptosyltransferase
VKPKLLVIELWGVGDLAIASPFLRKAAEKFDVTVVAKPYAEDLRQHFWPDVAVVPFNAPWTAFDSKYHLLSWPWRDLEALLRRLRREQFDVGISARWDPRDHLLLRLAGAKTRLGFPRIGSRLLLSRSLTLPPPAAHRYEHWRVIARALDLDLEDRYRISLKTEKPMQSAGPEAKRQLILVHSGARLPARIWPLEHWRNLARRLRKENYSVQVACDPGQQDWWRNSGETGVASPRTVAELLSLIDQAGVFVGNCSGPGHLAAISGVPTFTIFGPSLPEWFAPMHPHAQWIEGKPCPYKPCSDYCRFPVPKCLYEVSEEEAFPAIDRFVAKNINS